MNELKCGTARTWLQAPDELVALHARILERHLLECSACAEYRHRQVESDALIRQSLIADVGTTSVHARVHARLAAAPPPYRPAVRTPWRTRLIPRFRPARPVFALPPIAAVAALAALFLPQIISGGRLGVTPAGTTVIHAIRPTIGYPLAVDPVHSNHVLAGAWGEVYESWNAGASWHALAPMPRGITVIRDLAIDASNPKRYVVAAKLSVVVSDDAGKHWIKTAGSLPGVENMFVVQHPRAPGTFFVGPSVLWKSTDAGRTWQQDGSSTIFAPDGIQSLAFTRQGDLLTGIWGGGVAISHDGGLHWQRRSNGLWPNVLNVTTGTGQRLWAATQRGLYGSVDLGLHWHRVGPPGHLFTTSVIDGGSYVLVGGNGGVFRSTDQGKHWQITDQGLPLAPYVFGFIADPHNPNRVYASLNSDGIFRSDDGGQHWQVMDTGLPLVGQDSTALPVLFQRSGVLWYTDGNGNDPGILTVDAQVRVAAVARDGASIMYLNGDTSGWTLRVLAAGGSATRTLVSNSGPLPRRVLWSPSSLLVAVIRGPNVIVADLSAHSYHWAVPPGQHLLGWSRDGHALLFWGTDGRVTARSATTGQPLTTASDTYQVAPVPAPDGKHWALVAHNTLQIGAWGSPTVTMVSLPGHCRINSWSDDSTRLLLACPGGVEEWAAGGYRVNVAGGLPRNTVWVPGSGTDLLFYRRGSLWRWSPGNHTRRLVRNAQPVQPATSR